MIKETGCIIILYMAQEENPVQQPLEGWDDVYIPTREEQGKAWAEHLNEVVAQVRAEAPQRYRERERERLSRPVSPEAQARRERMKRLLRPLG